VNRAARYGQPRRGRAACHGRAKQRRAVPGREPRRTGPPRAVAQACCEQDEQSRREQPRCEQPCTARCEPLRGRGRARHTGRATPHEGRPGRALGEPGQGRAPREERPRRGLGHAAWGRHGRANRALAAHRRHAGRAPGRGPRGWDRGEQASRGEATRPEPRVARRAPVPGPTASGGGGGGGAAGRPGGARRGTPGSRRTPWPSSDRAEPRHPVAREGGGEGRGRRRRRGLPWDGVERTDAVTAVSGDENDGERRKKHRGEKDEHGVIPRLTGGPHLQRRRLPNRLPHRPGERAAPTRWRLGRAEVGRRGSGPRREGEKGGK
jgi:hypothetical protein